MEQAAADEDEQPAAEPEPGPEQDEDEDEDTEQPAADEDEPPSSRTRGSSRAVTAAARTVSAANEPVRGPGTIAQKRSRQRQRSQTGSKRRKKKKAVKVNGKRSRGWVDVAGATVCDTPMGVSQTASHGWSRCSCLAVAWLRLCPHHSGPESAPCISPWLVALRQACPPEARGDQPRIQHQHT
eukprot:COSAG01_NODE_21819_length_883_cov_1.734694_2_plen_183_part_00